MSIPIIVVFYYNENDYDFEVLLPNQGLNLEKHYDGFVFYTPIMIGIKNEFCLEYLELEKDIFDYYDSHPYKMNCEEQLIIDAMELKFENMKKIIKELIKSNS